AVQPAVRRLRVTTRPEEWPERGCNLGCGLAVAGSLERLVRLLELFDPASLGVGARLAEAEQRVGPPRVVLGAKVELGGEEPARGLEGVCAERPLRRLVEGLDRLSGDGVRALAEDAVQLDDARVVVGELLGELLGPRHRLQPGGRVEV